MPVPAERVGRLIVVKGTAVAARGGRVLWCMRGCRGVISARIWSGGWPG